LSLCRVVYKKGMRGALLGVAAAGLWLTPAVTAQVLLGNGQAPGISVQWNTPPPPPAPPPPPTTNHGSGGHNQGSSPGPTDQFLADQHTYAPRYDRASQRRGSTRFRRGYVAGYGYGGFLPYDYAAPTTGPGWIRPSVADSQGRLALQVTPASAQVLVDGFYVGVVEDFADRGLWLDPGPRRIEVRADGYDTATFDLRIVEGQTVSYQRDLARLSPRGELRQVNAVPKKFYVIRGCYAGDTPPSAARLPAGCRASDVREVPPTLNVIRK